MMSRTDYDNAYRAFNGVGRDTGPIILLAERGPQY